MYEIMMMMMMMIIIIIIIIIVIIISTLLNIITCHAVIPWFNILHFWEIMYNT